MCKAVSGCASDGPLSDERTASVPSHLRELDDRYRCQDLGDDALLHRMRTLAGGRRRPGSRRQPVLLQQEGLVVNRKRSQRLHREKALTVRKRRGRKKAAGTRAPIFAKAVPNARWSVDFDLDQLVTGRRLRILIVVNNVTKECLAAIVDTSILDTRVARVIASRGKPGLIVFDHGNEITSNAMLPFTQKAGIDWHFIAPGKPVQN